MGHDILFDRWNSWTEKSKHVKFKSSKKSYGDGEEMLSAELDVVLKGQNCENDFVWNGTRCEVKKLDNNTFNSGKNGRISVKEISHKLCQIDLILTSVRSQKYTDILTNDEKTTLVLFTNIFNDLGELSESKCRMNGTIHLALCFLCTLKSRLKEFIDNKVENCYTVFGAKMCMTEYQLYQHMKIDGLLPIDNYIQCELFDLLHHEYITEPNSFFKDTNKLTSVFQDHILFFVHPTRGFFAIKDPHEKIKFIRITRGNPRFYFEPSQDDISQSFQRLSLKT